MFTHMHLDTHLHTLMHAQPHTYIHSDTFTYPYTHTRALRHTPSLSDVLHKVGKYKTQAPALWPPELRVDHN